MVSYSRFKALSPKGKLGITIIIILIILLGSAAVCESRIKKARRLYDQGKYYRAYEQIENIPNLGREELIRMKIAWLAADGYENYLITKKIRLVDASADNPFDQEAYKEAFWELIFGLYVDLKDVKNPSGKLSAIELDEYNKFIDLMYSELLFTFYMSRDEANSLVERMLQLDELEEMKKAAHRWLDDNFFE